MMKRSIYVHFLFLKLLFLFSNIRFQKGEGLFKTFISVE